MRNPLSFAMLFVPARKGVIFSGCFQHLSLSLVFRSLITTCLGMDFSEMILFRVCSASWIYRFPSSPKFGSFSAIIGELGPTSSSSSPGPPRHKYRTIFGYSRTGRWGLFVRALVTFYFLCRSVWIISLVLASSLLIFFPLSFPPCCWAYSKAFISVIPFFSSKICIYFSFTSSIFLFRACSWWLTKALSSWLL